LNEEIGRTAGDIWQYLDRNGEASALKLRSALRVPQSLLFLSLGWLCREGKVSVAPDEGGHRISIKKD
jgi:hypothetical protein